MGNTAAKAACSWAMGLSLSELQPRPLSAPPACHPGWPLAPIAQPQLPRTLTPCQRVERLGTYSPWRFLFGEKKRKMPLTVSAWGAIEHVKTLRPELPGMWWSERGKRAERKTRLTKHPTSRGEMRDEREKTCENKTTGLKDINAFPPNMWRQAEWKCPLVFAAEWDSNDHHYRTLVQPIISRPLLARITQHVRSRSNQCTVVKEAKQLLIMSLFLNGAICRNLPPFEYKVNKGEVYHQSNR